MSELSKRLPDDNEKLQPLVGENSWTHNHVEMEDLNIKAAKLAGTNKTKFEEFGV